MKTLPKGFVAASSLVFAALAFQPDGHAQTSGQSDYVFRFNTGISSVFLANMTFPSQQSINLGSCTATEKINGPISCAVNCDGDSVCLLSLTGPAGSTVNDVMEKVSETPSTPTSAASPSPAASGVPIGYASLFRTTDRSSNSGQRIDAYNSAPKKSR